VGSSRRATSTNSFAPWYSVLILAYSELPGDRLHSFFELREVHDGTRFTDVLGIHVIELEKRPRLR
jgi:hypothetical protein